MTLRVDSRRIKKIWVTPWEIDEGLYGVAYECTDGYSGNDLIGTKEQADSLVRQIEAKNKPGAVIDFVFPKNIASS